MVNKRLEQKHQTYLEMATTMSKLSKDESSKVGAVIVDKNGKIVSLGYNGAPVGIDDRLIDYSGGVFEANIIGSYPNLSIDKGVFTTHKNNFMIHAEMNAILVADDRSRLMGSTCYITHYPCNNCANTLVQCGVSEVHVLDNKTKSINEYVKNSLFTLEQSGVKFYIHSIQKD
jgi:dCMP deaminase